MSSEFCLSCQWNQQSKAKKQNVSRLCVPWLSFFAARNYDYGRGGDTKEYAGFGWYGGAAAEDENAYGYGYTYGRYRKIPYQLAKLLICLDISEMIKRVSVSCAIDEGGGEYGEDDDDDYECDEDDDEDEDDEDEEEDEDESVELSKDTEKLTLNSQ